MAEYTPIHFYDEHIDVIFNTPPVHEKTPPCPNGMIWNGKTFHITESLSEWVDSLGRRWLITCAPAIHSCIHTPVVECGRFYFQVKVDSGQIFEIYYDRTDEAWINEREWFLYRELE